MDETTFYLEICSITQPTERVARTIFCVLIIRLMNSYIVLKYCWKIKMKIQRLTNFKSECKPFETSAIKILRACHNNILYGENLDRYSCKGMVSVVTDGLTSLIHKHNILFFRKICILLTSYYCLRFLSTNFPFTRFMGKKVIPYIFFFFWQAIVSLFSQVKW